MVPQFLIPLIRPTAKCERCGLHYKRRYEQCPHCMDIADGRALENFKQEHADHLQASSHLGTTFMWISVVLLMLFVLGVLSVKQLG